MLVESVEECAAHIANILYVATFHEHLRKVRGSRSQLLVADMAGVSQPYISRIEAGSANGVGVDALRRILEVYKEMETC